MLQSVQRHMTLEIEKVKGSRFIVDIAPLPTREKMDSFLESIRRREPRASHHCWAFRLDNGLHHSSDDGEPGGTAGPPILARIDGAELLNVGIVVTRYYGGTNLGTGGLVRSYGAAAAAGIAASTVIETVVTESVSFRYPYDLTTAVEKVLAGHGGVVTEADYTDNIQITADVPRSALEDFRSAITEATAGRIVI